MKVTLVYPRALAEPQGLSKVISLFASNIFAFKNYGIDMKVISRDTILGKEIVYNSVYDNLRLSILSKIRRWLTTKIILLSKSHIIFVKLLINRSYIEWSKKAIEYYLKLNDKPDIILFHDFFTCFEYLKLGIKNGPKIICVIHSIGIPLYGFKIDYPHLLSTKYFKDLEYSDEYVRNNADFYGFVSKSSVNNFLSSCPNYPIDKLFFIHNGVPDISNYSIKIKKSKLEICCVAGINNYKGQRHIVEAILDLKEKGKIIDNIHFTFVGDGDLKISLEKKVLNNDLSSYFSFVGQVNEVDYYLNRSDIFILPTSNDGLPMSIIEAMRYGLPIVSTKVGGIPELIDDEVNGIFIEPSVEGVLKFINSIDKYDWINLGKMSRAKYESQFTVSHMVEAYTNLFSKSVNCV